MVTKYGFSFDGKIVDRDLKRLTNQLWKLIPMYENDEDWKGHLDTVIEELAGLHNIFTEQLNFLILLSKLEGLYTAKDFEMHRKIVFSSIRLLTELHE